MLVNHQFVLQGATNTYAICIQQVDKPYSCFGMDWDSTAGYSGKSLSWKLPANTSIDTVNGTPNLATIEQVETGFPGCFGDWEISTPTQINDPILYAFRYLPEESWSNEHEWWAEDYRYVVNG